MTITKQHPYGPAFRSRLDLMGIRFMTEPDPTAGAGAGGGDAAAQAAAAAAAANAAGTGNDAPWTKENFDPERAFRLVENLRGDLAEQKTKTAQAIAEASAAAAEKAQKETLAQFAKLLGGGEQVETDPEKLNASLTALQTQLGEKDTAITQAAAALKAQQVATAVALLAPDLGGNTKLLLANEQFKTSIASAEPTDEAAIKAAITKALQENAALKQPPARSGAGEHTGPTVQSLEAQLKAAEEKKDVTETIRLKRAIAAARQAQTQ